MLITLIYGHAMKKREIERDNNKENDLYGKLCFTFNLLAGFIMFELFSFVIAAFIKSIILNVILHFPAWFISMWAAQWIFPHIVDRIVEIFVKPDK